MQLIRRRDLVTLRRIAAASPKRQEGRLMKRGVLVVLLAVGCGDSAKTSSIGASADLGVPDLAAGVVDQGASSDFFVGRYDCLQTLDQFCFNNHCVTQLADAINPDAGCQGLGSVAESCGSYLYVSNYYGGDLGSEVADIMVYDQASGQLVAILNSGPAGNSQCIAGPNVFVDPGILTCPGPPTDPTNPSGGSAPVQICAPVTEFPPCGGPLIRGGIRPAKCV
jgi:hypothetical protein